MSQRFKIKITEKEFDGAIIPTNYVAVELLRVEEDATTKSGILMGFNSEETWGTMEGVDGDTHPADVASVVGKVVKLPQKLYFNEDGSGMPWETEMELMIGDICWFNIIETLNAVELHVEGKVVRIIPYADIYVAKREKLISRERFYPKDINNNVISPNFFMQENKYEDKVVCLNGYCLLERIKFPKLSKLDVVSEDHFYDDRGIVRFIGEPNKRYTSKEQIDDIDVEVGQTAYLKSGYTPFLLERIAYNSFFDNGNLYFCVQRRRIMFVV